MSRALAELSATWAGHRRRTLDLLAALTAEEMRAEPGGGVGPLWKQFRHVGRVQEDYLGALSTGIMRFDPRSASYAGGPSAEALAAYLVALDRRLETFLAEGRTRGELRWPGGETVPLVEHFRRLIEHEVLHHGMWIVQARLRGRTLPSSWSDWGEP